MSPESCELENGMGIGLLPSIPFDLPRAFGGLREPGAGPVGRALSISAHFVDTALCRLIMMTIRMETWGCRLQVSYTASQVTTPIEVRE